MRIKQFIIRFAPPCRRGLRRWPLMGFPLYREVMEHGPDKIGPAELLLLLVLADDANDKTRLSFATRDKIVRRMRVSDWDTVKKILGRLAERGLELRVTIGTDKNGRPYYARAGMKSTYRIPEFGPRGDDRPSSTRGDDGPPSISRGDGRPGLRDNHPGEGGPSSRSGGRSSPPSPHSSDDSSSLSGGDDRDLHQKEDQRREDRDLDLAIVDQLHKDTGTTIPATWVPNVRRAIFGGDGTPGPAIKHPPSYARKTISGEPDKRGRFLPSPEPPRLSRPQPAQPPEATPPHQREPDGPAADDTGPPMSTDEIKAFIANARRQAREAREAKRLPVKPAPQPPDPNAKPTPDEEEHRRRQMAMLTAYEKLVAGGMDSDEAMRTVRGEDRTP